MKRYVCLDCLHAGDDHFVKTKTGRKLRRLAGLSSCRLCGACKRYDPAPPEGTEEFE